MKTADILKNREKLQQMLSSCYELEGLITLALERDESTPDQVYDMIAAKVNALAGTPRPVTPSLPFDELTEEDTAAELTNKESKIAKAVEKEVDEPEKVAEAVEFEQATDAKCDVCDRDEENSDRTLKLGKITLTLGDKFRFTRELFDGNDIELREALNAVGVMTTKDEIDDYLYNDLCFDEMNPTVKEFEALVTKNLR